MLHESLFTAEYFDPFVCILATLLDLFQKNKNKTKKSNIFQTKIVPKQTDSQIKCVLGQIVSQEDLSLIQLYSEVVVFQTRLLPKLAVF